MIVFIFNNRKKLLFILLNFTNIMHFKVIYILNIKGQSIIYIIYIVIMQNNLIKRKFSYTIGVFQLPHFFWNKILFLNGFIFIHLKHILVFILVFKFWILLWHLLHSSGISKKFNSIKFNINYLYPSTFNCLL